MAVRLSGKTKKGSNYGILARKEVFPEGTLIWLRAVRYYFWLRAQESRLWVCLSKELIYPVRKYRLEH